MSGAVLRDACKQGDLFNLDRIIDGAQDFSRMRSPIYTGVQSDGWVRRKALLDVINDRDKYGFGSIHVCVKNDQPKALLRLMKIPGIDINLPGMGGYSAAVLACTEDASACLEILLGKGADPNQLDAFGWTLLHHCASEESLKCMQLLLLHRDVHVDMENSKGYTPCQMACIKNHAVMIESLVSAGADPQKKNKLTFETCYDIVADESARGAIASGLLRNQDRLQALAVEDEERQMLQRSKQLHEQARTAREEEMQQAHRSQEGQEGGQEGGEGGEERVEGEEKGGAGAEVTGARDEGRD